MLSRKHATHENRLLRALDPRDLEILTPHLQYVTLEKSHVLIVPARPILNAYFLTSGLTSVIAIAGRDQAVEVGLSGREGMIGTPLLLDADRTPHRVFMQIEGTAFQIPGVDLQAAMDQSASLRKTLLRYVQAFMIQTTFTALCNIVHTIEERLARWLLMSHDRQDGDEIPLTHDFLALMLGARRPSVTIALHSLEGLGFIRATRGLVTILRRAELEEFAGGAYGIPEAEYERLIGSMRETRIEQSDEF